MHLFSQELWFCCIAHSTLVPCPVCIHWCESSHWFKYFCSCCRVLSDIIYYAHKWLQIFFIWGVSISVCTFWGSSFTPSLDMTFPKRRHLIHLKWHLSLRFPFCITHLCIVLWSSPPSLYPTIRMSFAISNKLVKSLNISSTFHWNMSPADAVPNGNLAYLYLPKSQGSINSLQSTMWSEAWLYIHFTLLAHAPEQCACHITHKCPTELFL